MNTAHHDHPHAATPARSSAAGRERKLLMAFVLTTAMMIAEAFGGWWSGSLALLADAGHMLVDAVALLLAWGGAWLATRPADARRSYGYGRMEVLAGFVNALSQLLLVIWIVYEAVTRMLHPHAILPGVMLGVASAGLLVNIVVLRMLHGHAHDDVNMAGAALHVAGDLLGSLAAIVAALLIWRFGWLWADPALSLLVALLILASAWRLLRRSTHILLEGVPDGMDSAEIAGALREADASIADIHHLHVWQLASGLRMATLHATLCTDADTAATMRVIHVLLRERFDIQHVTVQVDAAGCPDIDDACAGAPPH
ncbi:MAG: cation diffusion facilitator family transporter [Rhodanobacter sp.]